MSTVAYISALFLICLIPLVFGEQIKNFVYSFRKRKSVEKDYSLSPPKYEVISYDPPPPPQFKPRLVVEPPDMSDPIDRAIHEELTRAQTIEEEDKKYTYPPYPMDGILK